jgi:hypothetical protein
VGEGLLPSCGDLYMKALMLAALMGLTGHNAVDICLQYPLQSRLPEPTLVGLSCSPRKTCSRTVENCEAAYWFMEHCSWGGKLERDNYGVPCENMCSGG